VTACASAARGRRPSIDRGRCALVRADFLRANRRASETFEAFRSVRPPSCALKTHDRESQAVSRYSVLAYRREPRSEALKSTTAIDAGLKLLGSAACWHRKLFGRDGSDKHNGQPCIALLRPGQEYTRCRAVERRPCRRLAPPTRRIGLPRLARMNTTGREPGISFEPTIFGREAGRRLDSRV
jgi:hypothetical protein